MLLVWCDRRERFGRRFLVLSPPPRLNEACLTAMGADVPFLCCTPCTAVRGSVAHLFCFYCVSCGRYLYTLLSDWALLFCCGFGGCYPSYRCPSSLRLVGVAATITDAGRSRGPYYAIC